MQTRSWDDKATGEKKYRTEIVADRVQFGPRQAGAAPAGGAATTAPAGKAEKGKGKGADVAKDAPVDAGAIEYPEEEINAEDIPF